MNGAAMLCSGGQVACLVHLPLKPEDRVWSGFRASDQPEVPPLAIKGGGMPHADVTGQGLCV